MILENRDNYDENNQSSKISKEEFLSDIKQSFKEIRDMQKGLIKKRTLQDTFDGK